MNRPNLILRRHGPMTFGLGYFQDGVWVDHLAADRAGLSESADGRAAQGDATPLDVVHDWFSCCSDPIGRDLPVEDREGAAPAPGIVLQAFAGTAER